MLKHVDQPYFDLIRSGAKTREGRIINDFWDSKLVNQNILFCNGANCCMTVITDMQFFTGIDLKDAVTKMLKYRNNLRTMLPNVNSLNEGVNIYLNLYKDQPNVQLIGSFGIKVV
jgi:ASC-1-like (ASCH) protein